MSGQNRLLAILLGVVAVLVLVVGGLSATLLLSGENSVSGDSDGPTGITTDSGNGGSGNGDSSGSGDGRQ